MMAIDADKIATIGHVQGTYNDLANRLVNMIASKYSPSSMYAVGQHVIYDAKLYVCKTPITTPEEWNSAHWEQVNLGDESADLNSKVALQEENIPGTTQTISFDSSGNVSQIVHTDGNAAVRTDVFTFGTNTITEVRTLSSGESLTIVTNTDTLVTTVTYAAA